jgi:hypothetical protein
VARQYAAAVYSDITELKRQECELAELIDKLEAAHNAAMEVRERKGAGARFSPPTRQPRPSTARATCGGSADPDCRAAMPPR